MRIHKRQDGAGVQDLAETMDPAIQTITTDATRPPSESPWVPGGRDSVIKMDAGVHQSKTRLAHLSPESHISDKTRHIWATFGRVIGVVDCGMHSVAIMR